MWRFTVFLKTLVFSVLLVLCFQCAQSPGVTKGPDNLGATKAPDKPATVTKGQDKLGVVNFPDWFVSKKTTPRGGSIIIATDRYEVRRAIGSFPDELLFEAVDNDKESSVNYFAASLDGEFKVRSVTTAEWTRAEPLSSTRYDPFSNETKATAAGAQYRGKTYAKTGQSWENITALPSPGGRWIVVFSHTSEKDNPSYGVMGGGGRGKGEMFIDVYDTSSGEKIFSGHAAHVGGSEPSQHFHNTLWVGDRFLIVPLDTQVTGPEGGTGGSCFLGIMPAP